MARYLKYVLGVLATLVTFTLLIGSFTWYTYFVFDVSAYGAVGDGVTNNNLPVQGAATGAAVAGGLVRFPCGVFKVTVQIVQNIPANKDVTWQGSGNCTKLLVSGANGPLFNGQSSFSSFIVRDMEVATDAAGLYTGMTWNQPPTNGTYFAANNVLDNVVFEGADFASSQTQYWGTGFSAIGVSNINVFAGQCNMIAQQGTCYSVAGSGVAPFPTATQINFVGTTINQCNIGLFYGEFVEGVTVTSVNMTGCNYGVKTPTTQDQNQLAITQSQFNTNIYAIDIENPGFFTLLVSNNLFIVNHGSAIKLQGSGHVISGNFAAAVNASDDSYFVDIFGGTGIGSVIEGNAVGDFHYMAHVGAGVVTQANFYDNKLTTFPVVGSAVTVAATCCTSGAVTALTPTLTAALYSYTPVAVIQGSSCQGVTATVQSTHGAGGWTITGITLTNGGNSCTAAPTVGIQSGERYFIDPTSNGTFISDSAPQNFEDLPLCGSGGPLVTGSKVTVVDGQPETYNAVLKGASGGTMVAMCAGVWLAH